MECWDRAQIKWEKRQNVGIELGLDRKEERGYMPRMLHKDSR